MAFGIISTLEQMAEELPQEPVELTPADDHVTDVVEVTELETELVENAEKEEEIDTMDTQLDIADDAMESMESLIESLEMIAENGGLDRNGACMLNHARESIYGRLGIRYTKEQYVSLEAFGDVSSRQYATQIALEEQQSKFKEIVNAIWTFIKNWCKKIVEFVGSWATATGRAKKRAEALKVKAREAEFGGEVDEAKLSKYANAMVGEGGKIYSASDAIKAVQAETNKLKDAEFASKTLAIMDAIKAGIDPDAQKSGFGAWLRRLNNFFKGPKEFALGFDPGVKEDNGIKEKWAKGDGNYYGGTVLPGGMRLVFFYSAGEGDDAVPQLAVDFIRFVKPAEGAKVDASTLPKNAGEVEQICSSVIDICSEREKVNQAMKDFSSKANAATEQVEKQVKGFKEEAAAYGRRVASFFRNLFNSVTKPFLALAKYCVTVCKYVMDLCALAMKGGKAESDSEGGSDES